MKLYQHIRFFSAIFVLDVSAKHCRAISWAQVKPPKSARRRRKFFLTLFSIVQQNHFCLFSHETQPFLARSDDLKRSASQLPKSNAAPPKSVKKCCWKNWFVLFFFLQKNLKNIFCLGVVIVCDDMPGNHQIAQKQLKTPKKYQNNSIKVIPLRIIFTIFDTFLTFPNHPPKKWFFTISACIFPLEK